MMSDQKTSCCFPLEKNNRPHRVVVDEAMVDDNSVMALHPNTMDQLNLYRGDASRRATVYIAETDDACREGHRNFGMVKRNHNWDQLNDDVVEEIARKIKLYEDFIAFRGVCSSWRSAVNVKKDFEFMSTQLPWLLSPSKTCTNHTYDFFSLSRGMSRQIVLPELHHKNYFCSKGWLLIINKYWSISMLHPFTGVHVELPPLDAFRFWHLLFHSFKRNRVLNARDSITKCVLSSNPSLTSDYVVMIIFEDMKKLAYARSGDKAWTTIGPWTYGFSDVTYYKGMFYAINGGLEIWAFDISDGKYPTTAQVVAKMPFHLKDFGCGQLYILESAGALLVVEKVLKLDCIPRDILQFPDFLPPYAFQFRVFDVNLSTNTWTWIEHLGNRALFLSQHCSLSVETTQTSYCQPNCIYFLNDCQEDPEELETAESFRMKHMAIYHMQSGRNEILKAIYDYDPTPLRWFELSY